MKFKIGDYQEVKEVEIGYGHSQLNGFPGWEVLGTYERKMESAHTEYGSNGGQRTVMKTTYQMMAIIGLASEGEVPHLTKLNTELHDSVSKSRKEYENLKSWMEVQINELMAKAGVEERKLKHLQEEHSDLNSTLEPLRIKSRRMEDDLALLQQAIGTIEFNKIVGAK